MASLLPRYEGAPLLASADETLSLRVCTGPLAGRVLRVTAPPCSIGPAEQCTFRVAGGPEDAVWCLISWSENGIVARSYCPHVLLNGQGFDEAPLAAGDRLSIGGVELEILSPSEALAAAENGHTDQRVRNLPAPWAAGQAEAWPPEPEETAQRNGRREHPLAARRPPWRRSALRGSLLDRRLAALQSRHDRLPADTRALDRGVARLAQAQQAAETLADLERLRDELQVAQAALAERQRVVDVAEGELKRQAGQVEQQREWLSREQSRLEADETAIREQAAELAGRWEQLTARQAETAAELQRQRESLQLAEESLDRQRRSLNAETAGLKQRRAELAAQQETLDGQRRNLDEQTAALQQDRAAWEALEADQSRQLEERCSRLAEAEAELAAGRAELELEQQRWQALREQSDAEHAERWTLLTEGEQALAVARKKLDEQLIGWETERVRARASLEQREAELREKTGGLEARQAAWELERRTWENELEAQRLQLRQQSDAVERKEQDLAECRQTLEQQRQQWQAERADSVESQQQLRKREEALVVARREADQWQGRVSELESERQQWLDERGRLGADLEAALEQLEAARVELSLAGQTSQSLHNELEELRKELARVESERNELSTVRAEALRAAEQERAAEASALEAHCSRQAAEAGIDQARGEEGSETAAVLERLRAELWRDQPSEDDAGQPAVQEGRTDGEQPPDSQPCGAAAEPAQEESDEDSLDEYMARLLERLGVKTPEAGGPAPSGGNRTSPLPHGPGAAPAEAADVQASVARLEARAAAISARQRAARGGPPEKPVDMGAMRELANLSARTAIRKHHSRATTYVLIQKSFMVAVALLAAAMLGWSHWQGNQMASYSAAASLTVAVFWTLQLVWLVARRSRQARAIPAEPEAVEAPAADSSAEHAA